MLLVLAPIAVLASVRCFPCCSISRSAVVWLDVVLLVVLVLLLAVEVVPAGSCRDAVVAGCSENCFSHSQPLIMGCSPAPSELLWDSGGFPPRRRFQEVTENRAEGGGGG